MTTTPAAPAPTQTKYWLATLSNAIARQSQTPHGYTLIISDHMPNGTWRAAEPFENDFIAEEHRARAAAEFPACLVQPIEPSGERWTISVLRESAGHGSILVIVRATPIDGSCCVVLDDIIPFGADAKTEREFYSNLRDQWHFRVGERVFNRTLRGKPAYAP